MIYLILIAAAAVALFFFLKGRKAKATNGGNNSPSAESGEFPNLSVKGVPLKWNYIYKTPNGASVGSAVAIKPECQPKVFQAIEYGIENQLNATKAKFPEWTQKRSLSDYVVGFIEPQATNMDGSPALMVHGQYQTAGTVIGIFGDRYPENTIILPHQAATDWRYLVYLLYSSWNESEHSAEFSNDQQLALSYATSGDVHQHHNLPDGVAPLIVTDGGAKNFFGAARPRCYFAVPEEAVLNAVDNNNRAEI